MSIRPSSAKGPYTGNTGTGAVASVGARSPLESSGGTSPVIGFIGLTSLGAPGTYLATNGAGNGGEWVAGPTLAFAVHPSVLTLNQANQLEGIQGAAGDYVTWSSSGTTNYNGGSATDGTNIVAATTSGNIYLSTDGGVTFAAVAVLPSPRGLFFGNGLYVAVCAAGALYTSPDGITWTSRTTGVATALNCGVWDGTQFVVGGSSGTLITSPTGATWTAQTFGVSTLIRSLAWTGTVLVACGSTGMIRTSPTAVTWTARTSGVATELWDVMYDTLNAQVVAVGAAGVILTSPTGTTWTARTSGVATILYQALQNASGLVAYGELGAMLSSPTGVTWTPRASGVATDLYTGNILSGAFVVMGAAGAVITSPTGTTWSLLSSGGPRYQTPIGTGSLLAQNGNKTINGNNTFTGINIFTQNATVQGNYPAGSIFQFVGADGLTSRLLLDAAGAGANSASFSGRSAGGTMATPTALATGNGLLALSAFGHNGAGYRTASSGQIGCFAAENWVVGANGVYWAFRTTAIGSATSAEVMRLSDLGNLCLGTTAAGTSAAKVLALTNTATPPSTSTGLAHLFGASDGGGAAILGLWQETAPAADVGIASTHSGLVRWNGSVYKVALTLVP